jgi:hypothetical protein
VTLITMLGLFTVAATLLGLLMVAVYSMFLYLAGLVIRDV